MKRSQNHSIATLLNRTQNELTLSRLKSLEKLSEIERLVNIQKIQQSNSQLSIKKFIYQMDERMISNFGLIKNIQQEAKKSVERLKHDSVYYTPCDSNQSTDAKKTIVKSYKVKGFQL